MSLKHSQSKATSSLSLNEMIAILARALSSALQNTLFFDGPSNHCQFSLNSIQ